MIISFFQIMNSTKHTRMMGRIQNKQVKKERVGKIDRLSYALCTLTVAPEVQRDFCLRRGRVWLLFHSPVIDPGPEEDANGRNSDIGEQEAHLDTASEDGRIVWRFLGLVLLHRIVPYSVLASAEKVAVAGAHSQLPCIEVGAKGT